MHKFKFPILAKPSGVTLEQHRFNVVSEGILDSHSYLTLFQKKITALSYQSDDFRELEKPYRIFATNKIRSLLEFYRPNLKIKDLSTASFIIHTIVENIVHELAFYPDETQDKEKVINEFAEMLYNYLFKEPVR